MIKLLGVAALGATLLTSVNVYAYSCGGGSVEDKCKCITEVREDIQSQQRRKSTQALRDEYRFWTDEYYKTCGR